MADLAAMEQARMAAFLSKGKDRHVDEKLRAVKEGKEWIHIGKRQSAAKPLPRIGAMDSMCSGALLVPSSMPAKAGPRTRFGDGDGSWWDRWLSLPPPAISSYAAGNVEPLNGFKRDRAIAEAGAWAATSETEWRPASPSKSAAERLFREQFKASYQSEVSVVSGQDMFPRNPDSPLSSEASDAEDEGTPARPPPSPITRRKRLPPLSTPAESNADQDKDNDSDSSGSDEQDSPTDAAATEKRQLYNKFAAPGAQWTLYSRYRDLSRKMGSLTYKYAGDEQSAPVSSSLQPIEPAVFRSVLRNAPPPSRHKVLGQSGSALDLRAPRSAAESHRPSTVAAPDVLDSARGRYIQQCSEQQLPPEPLIISKGTATRLSMPHYGIGDRAAACVAASIQAMPHLQILDLRDNRLSETSVRTLCEKLRATSSRISSIDLSDNHVGPSGAKWLSKLFDTLPSLTKLVLCHARLGDTGVRALEKGLLSPGCRLQELVLSHNEIGIAGGCALASVLLSNTTLKSLNVSWNAIRKRGAMDMGIAVRTNTTLTYLDVSWNGFGGDGAQVLGSNLSENGTLRHLDLSSNNVTGTAAQVLARGLLRNTTLTRLELNGNPVGQVGGRALLRALGETGDVRMISLENCNFDMEESVLFDPTSPAGEYRLDLSKPYDRTIAEEILRAARVLPGCTIARCAFAALAGRPGRTIPLTRKVETLDPEPDPVAELMPTATTVAAPVAQGRRKSVVRRRRRSSAGSAYGDTASVDGDDEEEEEEEDGYTEPPPPPRMQVTIVDNTGQEWQLPTEGFVEFVVSYRPERAKLWQATTNSGVSALVGLLSKDGFSNKDRRALLSLATLDLFVNTAQASKLVESMGETSSDVKVEAVLRLLPRLVDPDNSKTFINRHLDSDEQVVLKSRMGQLSDFCVANPTGHYRLDLSLESDRRLMQQLLAINGEQSQESRISGCADTSQYGGWDNFRNSSLNGGEFRLRGDFVLSAVNFGVLEFDFVSTERPVPGSKTMRKKKFLSLARKVAIGLRPVMVEATKEADAVAISNYQLAESKALEALVSAELAPQSAEARLILPPLLQANAGSVRVLKEVLANVREAVSKTWLTTAQAQMLMSLFPAYIEDARVDALVVLFSRMQTHRSMSSLIELLPAQDSLKAYKRLGWLNVWNPVEPDGYYDLLLDIPEERSIAEMLVKLAVIEPGENWEGESYNGAQGWELPLSWTKDVPRKGTLSLTYTSTGPGCAPDWDARARMLPQVLCGRDEDEDTRKNSI